MYAQTDVTSTYLTNADFEGDYSVFQNLNSGSNARAIYKPEGWTVNYSNSESNDITALDDNSLQWSNFSSKPKPQNGGNKTYWIRFRWGNSEILTLSQTATLPAGKYCFSADAFFNGASGASAKISANSNSTSITGNSTWSNYEVNFVLASETSVTFSFNLTQTQQIENIAGFDNFKLTYTEVVVKDILQTALIAATNANAKLNSSDLASAIATAQAVYDNENATQEQVNSAAATLNAATELAMSAAGDVTGVFLTSPGFESCTETTTNAAASDKAAPLDIAGGWTQVSSATWSSSAVVAYGGTGQVNGASAPSADNAGNTGKTLGISVGWGGLVTYQSDAVTLPAGVYTLQAFAYNAHSGATQFTSKFGFVPTTGTSTLSTKTAFAYGEWETDKVTFTLNEATEGKIQIGGQAISGGSGSNAKVFFDNITITYKSFLTAAKADWEEAVAAAKQAKTDCPNVTGEELTALNAELAKAEPTTVDGYNEAIEALTTATATFTAAKTNYDALVAEIAKAKELGVDEETANSYAATSESTATSVLTNIADLKTAEFTYITETKPLVADITALMTNPSFEEGADAWNSGWTTSRNTTGNFDYKYDPVSNETADDGLLDGTNVLNAWAPQINYINVTQKVTLPAGYYRLTASVYSSLIKNQHIAAIADGTTYNSETLNGNTWQTLTVDFPVTTQGDVTLGIYSNGNNANGNQDGWFKADNFKLYYLGDASATMKISDAKYATFIAPYAVAIPDGVTAYTIDGVESNGNTLTMTEVNNTIDANKPVVLFSENTIENVTYERSTATEDTYTEGLLTGVYTATSAPVGSYVLQNNNSKVGFYKVAEGKQPTVGANRCYLTEPTEARTAYFFGGETTGIDAVNALTNGSVEVFNAAGTRVPSLQKGMNIIRKADGTSYKVMVK